MLTEAIESNRFTPNDLKTGSLNEIADSFAKFGDIEKASALLTEAIRTASQISSDSDKVSALSRITDSLVKLGDKDKARVLLAEAINTTHCTVVRKGGSFRDIMATIVISRCIYSVETSC